jgi:hypothetical protein
VKIPTKDLELWLLGWSESHSGGCKVTFQVSEDDLEYFKNATIRKGKHAGQRYAAVLVQLNDDETPDPQSVDPTRPPKVVPPPPAAVPAAPAADGPKPSATHAFPGGFTGLAVRWCQDEEFRDWLADNFEFEFDRAVEVCDSGLKSFPVDVAAKVVRDVCGVPTRADLNTSHAASLTFDTRIRGPYMAHLEELKVDA